MCVIVMREVGNGSDTCWRCSRMLEANEMVAGHRESTRRDK